MAQPIYTRGGTAGIDLEPFVDGQILFDKDRTRILLDAYVDGTLTRIVMTEKDTFNGTTAEWNALTSEQKEIFTYVHLTDDYEFKSAVFVGATEDSDGSAGLVPGPLIADRNKILSGSGEWVDHIIDDNLDSSSENPVQNRTITNALSGKLNSSLKGAANGLAELDNTGKIPASQLPGTLNLLEKYPTVSDFPAVGDDYTLYVAEDTNFVYRWTGSDYVQIDASIQIGETSQTAFRGDHGKVAYDHAYANKGIALSSGLYKITTNSEGHVSAGTAVTKSDITDLGIPGSASEYSITDFTGAISDLGNFVGETAKGELVSNFMVTDTNNVFGLGSGATVRGSIQYTNAYDGTNDVGGNGFIYTSNSVSPIFIEITGITSFTLLKQNIVTPTKEDIGLGNVENLNYKKMFTYSTSEPTGVWNGCVWVAST